ncbi:MAG: MCE family protein [Thermoleophilaceae bacterium]|nr:MCE family protein [Thermoleophilaceae bacterium]
MTLHHGSNTGMSLRKAGLIGIIVLSVLVYFAFSKDIPFTGGYEVNAYFNNAANIQPKAQVRVAGVKVGTVARVERGDGATTKVVMTIDKKALPIRQDAAARIRFRIFLEGNPFVDLQPGTPGSPEIKSGGSIPVAQTAGPVQLDQVLSSVNSDAREGLENVFTEIGTALNTVGTPEENKTQEDEVKRLTGAEALNRAFRYGPDGFKGGARVFDALIGSSEDDQLTILRGFRDFNSAINDRETQIVPLIADFATTMGAFADDEVALAAATKQFSRLAYESEPTLRELNLLLPELTRWSNTIAPKLKEIPETVRAAYPWIEQTNLLLGEDELGGTAPLAQSTVEDFAKAQASAQDLLPELDNISRCWNKIWFPTLNTVVPDGANTSGKQNYKEFWYSLVGWNGATQNFTGAGSYLRLTSGSAAEIQSPMGDPNRVIYGNSALPQTGRSPLVPGTNPGVQTKVSCYKNTPPNLAPTKGSTP